MTDLARVMKVTPSTIRAYEQGTRAIRGQHLGELAKALEFPQEFFLAGDVELIDKQAPSFRAASSLRAAQRNAALATGSLSLELDSYVQERFNLPQTDVPDLAGYEPETAAAMVRRHWGMGDRPIPNVVHRLEAKGIRVFFVDESLSQVDAFSLWVGGGTPICLLNPYKSAERGRMDAAHELGHLVLHRDGARGHEAERQADEFAAAFLMPAEGILASAPRLSSLRKLLPLKFRWRVSLAAMVRRLYTLNLISRWHYENLCIQLSKMGALKSEPEPCIERERSLLFEKIFTQLWKQGITRQHVAQQLCMPLAELDTLTMGAGVESKPSHKATGLRLVP